MRSALKTSLIRRWPASLAGLVLLAVALRLVYCLATLGPGRSLPTLREYEVAATRLLERGHFESPLVRDSDVREPSNLLPPAYVLLVAGVYRAFGIQTPAATLVLHLTNALATSLAVVPVFFVARRLGGQLAGWLAAGLLAVNPIVFGFTNLIWDTCLFTLAVAVVVWVTCRLLLRRPGPPTWRFWLTWLGFGLLLGALALLNPALTLCYPVLVLWPLVRVHGWRPKPLLIGITASVAGWLIAIAPWTVRNYVRLGQLSYIRGGFGLELWLGVCPEADGQSSDVYPCRFPLLSEAEQERIAELGEQGYLRRCARQAVDSIAAHPVRYLGLVGLRAVDYWAGTLFTNAPPGQGGWPRRPARALVAAFMTAEVVLVLLALSVAAARRTVGPDARWLIALLLCFSATYCITHVMVRFRTPSEPALAVLAAVLIARALPPRPASARQSRGTRPGNSSAPDRGGTAGRSTAQPPQGGGRMQPRARSAAGGQALGTRSRTNLKPPRRRRTERPCCGVSLTGSGRAAGFDSPGRHHAGIQATTSGERPTSSAWPAKAVLLRRPPSAALQPEETAGVHCDWNPSVLLARLHRPKTRHSLSLHRKKYLNAGQGRIILYFGLSDFSEAPVYSR